MQKTIKQATKHTITADELFTTRDEQKTAKLAAVQTARYAKQVLHLLHCLAQIEDDVRSGKISAVRAERDYSILLTALRKIGDRALRLGASVQGLWAEKVAVFGTDLTKYQ